MTAVTAKKLTYDDYVDLPEDGNRYEIIDGELYVNPSPNTKHQRVLGRLFIALSAFVDAHDLGEVFMAPLDVVMSRNDVVQPDVLFVSSERSSVLTKANVQGAPDIAIEVLSDGTRRTDETTKLARYEQFGVREYWLVDPDDDSIRILRLSGRKFERIIVGGNITSPLLPGFSLGLRDLFAEKGSGLK